MDQISKPYRIALGAVLVLVVAWFLVLKPKDPAAEATAPAAAPVATTTAAASLPPGVQGLSNDVARARSAASAQEGVDRATGEAIAQVDPATTTVAAPARSTATTPSAPTTAGARAEASADPAGAILGDLRRGDVAVVAFVQPGGADDADVRRALGGLSGPVRTHLADIDAVGDYGKITNGVPVTEAPTTLVIGADRRARVLTGLVGVRELQQVVDDQAR